MSISARIVTFSISGYTTVSDTLRRWQCTHYD